MNQIFQFDQEEICTILADHLQSKGFNIVNTDINNMGLYTMLPDDTPEFLDGQIQLRFIDSQLP